MRMVGERGWCGCGWCVGCGWTVCRMRMDGVSDADGVDVDGINVDK